MSTRSVICGMTPDGPKVNFINYDGYPEFPGVGSKLLTFYGGPESARELLELGDMVSLGKTPEDCEIPEEWRRDGSAAYPVDDRPDEALRDTLMRAMAGDSGLPIKWGYVFENGRWDCIASPHYEKEWNGVPLEQLARDGLEYKTISQFAVIAGMTDDGPAVIWIHGRGIPEAPGLGRTLLERYGDAGAVKELLAGGDLNALGTTPEENAEFSRRKDDLPTMLEVREASTGVLADTVMETVKSEWIGSGVTWAYLFNEDGVWECCQAPWFAREWEGAPLEDVVAAREAEKEAEDAPTP